MSNDKTISAEFTVTWRGEQLVFTVTVSPVTPIRIFDDGGSQVFAGVAFDKGWELGRELIKSAAEQSLTQCRVDGCTDGMIDSDGYCAKHDGSIVVRNVGTADSPKLLVPASAAKAKRLLAP